MRIPRRCFLGASLGAAAGSLGRPLLAGEERPDSLARDLERIARSPVLERSVLPEPVVVESIELLHRGGVFLVRARSRAGVESITAPNASRLREAYPVFLRRVAPFFEGKDARDIEGLLVDLYRRGSNYKLQGLLYWCCVAAVEMALLDLLGRTAEKPIGELFGGVIRRDIPVYRASSHRGNRPEEEVEYLARLVEETGVRAVKLRLGGRMSRNADSLPGRSEALVPLARKRLGDRITLYADANSSYDVEHAVRLGRLMEEHGYGYFEEPCPFDHIWETKAVADRLEMPVAGGEQEFSTRRFRWAIENRGLDIVQPDLHYFGGYIRATRVARMAARAGLLCTPHMSGGGLGYMNVLHFVSYTPNAGPFHEFKGEGRVPVECDTSTLRVEEGSIRCPSGPGFGVTIDPDFVAGAEPVTTL